MVFEYKCVAGPTIVAVRNAKVRDQAVKAFEDIMNAEAAEGWEYVGIDEFHVSEPQGLLSRKRVYVPSKILVFRRSKKGSAFAEAMKVNADTVSKPSPAPEIKMEPKEALPAPSMKAIAEKVKSPQE